MKKSNRIPARLGREAKLYHVAFAVEDALKSGKQVLLEVDSLRGEYRITPVREDSLIIKEGFTVDDIKKVMNG